MSSAAFPQLQEQLQELDSLRKSNLISLHQYNEAITSVLRNHGLAGNLNMFENSSIDITSNLSVPEASSQSNAHESTTSTQASLHLLPPAQSDPQGVELLIHNISHSDLVLSVNTLTSSLEPSQALARPKFSNFRSLTKQLMQSITEIPLEQSIPSNPQSNHLSNPSTHPPPPPYHRLWQDS